MENLIIQNIKKEEIWNIYIWYWDDKFDAFVLVATININKGEELTDNYGVKTNIVLLYYGFTIDSNPTSILSFNLNGIYYLFSLQYNLMKLEQKVN